MKASHIRACGEIVSNSDPWKRLNERIDFRAALSGGRMHMQAYVCLAGTDPVGFVLFTPEPVFARGGYLKAIGVAPAFRGKGVGSMLLSFAEQVTASRAQNFFLCVSSFNRRAMAFYKSCGYCKVGSLRDLIVPGASEHIFWKRLETTSPRTRRARQ
jgi:ribosomal protein S18 acetylase RimI-like enzyme